MGGDKFQYWRDKKTGASLQYGFVELLTAARDKQTLEYDYKIDRKNVSVKLSGNKELDEKYQIFVGGLLKETSQETLHCHFSKFGDIFACDIVRNNYNLSIEKLLSAANRRHWTSQFYRLQSFSSSSSRPGRFDDARTLMVTGLSRHTTVAVLRECFSRKQLEVTDCRIAPNKQTGTSRKFGLVSDCGALCLGVKAVKGSTIQKIAQSLEWLVRNVRSDSISIPEWMFNRIHENVEIRAVLTNFIFDVSQKCKAQELVFSFEHVTVSNEKLVDILVEDFFALPVAKGNISMVVINCYLDREQYRSNFGENLIDLEVDSRADALYEIKKEEKRVRISLFLGGWNYFDRADLKFYTI